MIDVKRLHYFCVIVEQGQISRAAKVLNMTQPPLSQRLKELEEELGTALIIREGGVWELTEAGKVLYRHAKRILLQMGAIRDTVHEAVEGVSGEISIGVSTATVFYIENILPSLQRRYPKLHFRLKVADSSTLEEELRQRELDMAILLLPLEKQGLRVHLLPEDTFSAVFPKNLAPQGRPTTVSLHDLADLPLVISRRWAGWGGYEDIMALMHERGYDAKVVLDSQNIQALVRIMQCGFNAVMLVPSKEVTLTMRSTFTICVLKEAELTLSPAIVYDPKRPLNLAATTVLNTLLAAWGHEEIIDASLKRAAQK